MQVTYFDGRLARAHEAALEILDGRLRLAGPDIVRDEPLEAVQISDWLGSTPRFLVFSDGAVAEAADGNALGEILRPHVPPSRVTAWERSRIAIPVALAVILTVGVLGYRFALPAVADVAARRMPERLTELLSDQVIAILDRTLFVAPTRVPRDRQADLIFALARLRFPGGAAPHLRLVFRSGGRIGANALSLPSGKIIVTDGMMALADDRELLAVLAHEAGHVIRRHGLRNMAQTSMLTVLLTWYIGDVSTLAAIAPTMLLQAKYSRDFEREADRFAVETLRLNGLPPSLLADVLERLDAAARRQGGITADALGYLSSHPATAERLATIRGQ
jgi:Zn-dependent protease with chaperone function